MRHETNHETELTGDRDRQWVSEEAGWVEKEAEWAAEEAMELRRSGDTWGNAFRSAWRDVGRAFPWPLRIWLIGVLIYVGVFVVPAILKEDPQLFMVFVSEIPQLLLWGAIAAAAVYVLAEILMPLLFLIGFQVLMGILALAIGFAIMQMAEAGRRAETDRDNGAEYRPF